MGRLDATKLCNYYWQNHVDHDVSDPLVAVQLDASNAFCCVARQFQFDVLPVRHPVLMTMKGHRLVTNSLDRAP